MRARFSAIITLVSLIAAPVYAQNVLVPSTPAPTTPAATPDASTATTTAPADTSDSSSMLSLDHWLKKSQKSSASTSTTSTTSQSTTTSAAYVPTAMQATFLQMEIQKLNSLQQGLSSAQQVYSSQATKGMSQAQLQQLAQSQNQEVSQHTSQIAITQQHINLLQAGPMLQTDFNNLYGIGSTQ